MGLKVRCHLCKSHRGHRTPELNFINEVIFNKTCSKSEVSYCKYCCNIVGSPPTFAGYEIDQNAMGMECREQIMYAVWNLKGYVGHTIRYQKSCSVYKISI